MVVKYTNLVASAIQCYLLALYDPPNLLNYRLAKHLNGSLQTTYQLDYCQASAILFSFLQTVTSEVVLSRQPQIRYSTQQAVQPLNHSGYSTKTRFNSKKICSLSAVCICVCYDFHNNHNKRRLFSYTALTNWFC